MYETELYHHGVKGMKWGVRRYQNEDGSLTDAGKKRNNKKTMFQRDGSDKTVKKLDAFLDADKKYGRYRTVSQNKKVYKLYEKYDKSAEKDINKALKEGNTKAANSIAAGRTYMRMLMDRQYLNKTVSDAMVKANVQDGKEYTYNVTRDDNLGGVVVTTNGVSNTYSYKYEPK